MTIAQARRRSERALERAGVPDAGADADWLLCHVLDMSRSKLFLSAEKEFSPKALASFEALVERRARREPLQRLTGEAWFMGLRFIVFDDVLIPRADTEALCEAALGFAKSGGCRTALDMCCGSGILAVSLAKLGALEVTACDISEKCAEATRRNARANGVSLRALTGDMFSPVRGERFDLIACNPPYIRRDEGPALQEEVRLYDPALALFAGEDGLDFYRVIAREAAGCINGGGALFMEVGAGQARDVADMFPGRRSSIMKDLNGVERVVQIQF